MTDRAADEGSGTPESAQAQPVITGVDRSPDRVQPGPEQQQDGLNRTARFAWGAVAVILVGVVGLIVYALAGTSTSPGVVHRVQTSSSVIAQVGKVPVSVFDSVGVTSSRPLVVPTVLSHQPPLESAGKPEVLFVGADYCPFCAAERWPLIVALARFGHFTTLHNMQSAMLSVFPGIQSFSFVGTRYSSRYVTFSGVELYSDSIDSDGAYTPIATLTASQAAVMNRYGSGTGPGGRTSAFPFVDIGNQLVTSTAGFSPALILGHSQSAIAGSLSPPLDAAGQAILASANYLTAGICRATAQRPAAVCSSNAVQAADNALGAG